MGRTGVRIVLVVVALTWALTAVDSGAAPAAGLPGCAPPKAGGEWRTYGHDLANTRSQPDETVIGTRNVSSLRQAWAFSTRSLSTTAGDLTGTPIVADGCVYAGSNGGWVFALNADTGRGCGPPSSRTAR